MRIAIASGKGGTGKTTVAVNLAWMVQARLGRLALVDCDVEEPNGHLFLDTNWELEEDCSAWVPEVDGERCLGEACGKCVDLCRYKCLLAMAGEVLVFPEMCHGCGLCRLACPAGAVRDSSRGLGVVRVGEAQGVKVYGGLLRVGEAMASPLIRKLKMAASAEPVQIVDCPPGTACPVITSLDEADCAVLVAEPTAFGLHDLRLAADLLRRLAIPFGVVINRDGSGDERVAEYLAGESIPLLGRLPYSAEAARVSSEGGLLARELPVMAEAFAALWDNLSRRLCIGGAA